MELGQVESVTALPVEDAPPFEPSVRGVEPVSTAISREPFFRFPRMLVDEGRWSTLNSPAKSVFLCIAGHAGKDGVAWPSQETVGALTNYTRESVSSGVNNLMKQLPGFFRGWKEWIPRKGRQQWRYQFSKPSPQSADWFPIPVSWLKDGTLAKIGSSGCALYPVLRGAGDFSYDDALSHFQDLDADRFETQCPTRLSFGHWFPYRPFDLCRAETKWLKMASGISSPKTIKAGLNTLGDAGLLQEVSRGRDGVAWMVNLWPHASLGAARGALN